jgi:hypothetical protein
MLASADAPEAALVELHREYASSGAGNPGRRRDIGLWAGHFGDHALALEAMRAAIAGCTRFSVISLLSRLGGAEKWP